MNWWRLLKKWMVLNELHSSRWTSSINDINVNNEIDPDDKKHFESLCQFVWIQGDPLLLIFDIESKVYTDQGITREQLERFNRGGLIIFEPSGFVKKGFGRHTRLFYCGKPTKIGFQADGNNELDLGQVLLTKRGKEIVSTLSIPRNQQFYEYVIDRWFQQGLILSSIQIEQNQKMNLHMMHHDRTHLNLIR